MEEMGQAHAPSRFTPGRDMSQCPLNGRLDGYQSWSGPFGKEQIHYLCRVQTPDCPSCSLVTILTVLFRVIANKYGDTMRSEMFRF